MKRYELVETTCKKCGRRLLASPQSLNSEYGRICSDCGMSNKDHYAMLDEQAKLKMKAMRK